MILRNTHLRPSETVYCKGVCKQNTYVGLDANFGITTNGKNALFIYRYYIVVRNIRDIRYRSGGWHFESATFTYNINNCVNIGNSLYIDAIQLLALPLITDVATIVKN